MNTKKIIKEFNRIKKMGFIPSNRIHNTGIGKTFEDYLGVLENNSKDSDFVGFEVKSHRELAKSKITLFTKQPSYPEGANSYLRLKYGKPDEFYPEILVLHTSMFGDRFNTFMNKYAFKIFFDTPKQRVSILIKELGKNKLLKDEIYYTFSDIEKATSKLKNLFVVYADTKFIDNQEHFHFTKAEIYLDFNLDNFHKAIENGLIQYDVRIGAYKTGKSKGRTHDHGSGFRIDRNHLKDLYSTFLTI
jgi:hypothetical protein